jgi:hypothetical protein
MRPAGHWDSPRQLAARRRNTTGVRPAEIGRGFRLALVATWCGGVGSAGIIAATAGRAGGPDRLLAGLALWLLLGLFVLRVLGQVIVVRRQPGWLPPMQQWYSGLLPYRYLMPIQLFFIVAMTTMAIDVTTGAAVLSGPFRDTGRLLMVVSYLYASGMVVRYVLRMRRRPDQRWFGGTIPIVFHCVLASFLFIFARYHAG